MSQKPFNLDQALEDFRVDTPSPEARRRARSAFVRQPKKSWRLAAVAGVMVLLLVPVALRTRGSTAMALSFGKALQASKAAPCVTQTIDKRDKNGHLLDHQELIWAPGYAVERLFFHNGVPGLENRHTHTTIFERVIPEKKSGRDDWKPYEAVQKVTAPVVGTEGDSFFQVQSSLMENLKSLKPVKTEGGFAWFNLSRDEDWKVEIATNRIVRTEIRDKGTTFISVFTYPDRIAPSLLEVPPIGALPRFDYDQERVDMERLNRVGDRTTTVLGRKVKLVGVFQEISAPGQPLYVAFQGKGIARISGYPKGFSTTMKSVPPKVVATVVVTSGPVQTVDVEIPIPGTKQFAKFIDVRVRPVSVRIRSSLRTPAYN